MQTINDDMTILGKLTVAEIDGQPFDDLKHELDQKQQAAVEELSAELATKAVAAELDELKQRYNQAIEVINNLSERVTALESNYDPTVIS